MTSKTIIAGLVAIAFVAGSMTIVTADAKKGDSTLEAIFGLVMELETQIISMQSEIIALSTGGTGGTGPKDHKEFKVNKEFKVKQDPQVGEDQLMLVQSQVEP